MKISKLITVFFACFLLVHSQKASAAEQAVVSLKAGEIKEGDSKVQVSCEISSQEKMTNGKFRITYDSSQLKLYSSEKGQVLADIAVEINDPVQGTKEEGEIVFVFASATGVDANGSMLDMVFDLEDTVRDGDQIKMDVKVEQLASDTVNLDADPVSLNVTVGGQTSQSGTGSESETKKQQEQTDSNTNQNETNGNSGTSGNGGNSGNNGSGGNSGDTSAAKPVKTGDSTGILAPLLFMGAAIAVLALGAYRKKAKTR